MISLCSQSLLRLLSACFPLQAQFFGPESYQQFNLFTSFFYDTSDGQKYCEHFLHSETHDKIVLIIDPPFGGMTDIIANTMRQLWMMIGTGKVFWYVRIP